MGEWEDPAAGDIHTWTEFPSLSLSFLLFKGEPGCMHLGLGRKSNEEVHLISNNLQVFTDNGQGGYSRAERKHHSSTQKCRDTRCGKNQTRRVGAKICWGFLPLCAFTFPKVPSWLPKKEANTESNSNYSLISSPLHVEGSGTTKNEIVFIVILLLLKIIKGPSSTELVWEESSTGWKSKYFSSKIIKLLEDYA